MNEKWEVRWERLRICECSLGAREPGGAGARPLLGWGQGGLVSQSGQFPPLPREEPSQLQGQGPQGSPQNTYMHMLLEALF